MLTNRRHCEIHPYQLIILKQDLNLPRMLLIKLKGIHIFQVVQIIFHIMLLQFSVKFGLFIAKSFHENKQVERLADLLAIFVLLPEFSFNLIRVVKIPLFENLISE